MSRKLLVILLIAVISGSFTHAAGQDAPLPDSYLAKLDSIPDICQVPPRAGMLPENGSQYCAPTSVANVLVWLDNNGFPNMVPDADGWTHYNLIAHLGKPSFMRVGEKGTGPLATMTGLEKYCRERGYEVLIEWQGWRNGGKYAVASNLDPRWLFEGVVGSSNVVLNIGWYRHHPATDTYERIAGHWVTMVGYDAASESGPHIVVHDPSLRTGRDLRNDYYRLMPIRTGNFAKWHKYEAGPASGWLMLEGIRLKRGADCAVLDGAFRFRIIE